MAFGCDLPVARTFPTFSASRDDLPCQQTDPELFFPIERKREAAMPAIRVCRHCPAIVDCLEWALETDQQHGIWGGKSENERRAILRRPDWRQQLADWRNEMLASTR
jgi:WhiB family redox-sensing transcriptional regulator